MIRNINNLRDKEQIIENEALVFGKSHELIQEYAKYINYDNTFGLFSESGLLKSSLSIYPRKMYSQGMHYESMGIGHVATRPEYRMEGNMKKLLQYVLNYGYENNYDIGMLYPYKYELYKGSGFRIGEYSQRIEIALDKFICKEEKGKLIKFTKNKQDIVNELHLKYIQYIEAGDMDDPSFLEKDCGRIFRYFWVNGNEKIKSYIEFIVDDNQSINIEKFFFFDDEGIQGMLGILSSLAERYNKLIWEIPYGINIYEYISGVENVLIQNKVKMLVRIINLEGLISKIVYNYKDIVINVTDGIIQNNNGNFLLSSNGNKKLLFDHNSIDIKMDISELTSMLFDCYKKAIKKNDLAFNDITIKMYSENFF